LRVVAVVFYASPVGSAPERRRGEKFMVNEELNKQVFQSLFFMQQVFDVLEEAAEDNEDKLDEYWGAEGDAEEGGPAAYVVIDLREKGKKDSLLDVTRWFPQEGCEQKLGLYINVLRSDEDEIWESLKAAFPEAKVEEDDTRLGFEWTLPAGASRAEAKDAGQEFAKRIVDAIWEE